MHFCWTTITVKDLDESLRFYTEIIGLPIMNRFIARPGTEIAFLGEGETQVELIAREDQPDVRFGPDISLGFVVPSLDEAMAFIREKGMAIHAGPFQPNPNTRFFYVLDPNGLKIQFVERK